MNKEIIAKELEKFNVTDATIAKLTADYMALTVRDATDDNGYKVVKSARMEVVHLRGKIEKTRVILKADSLEYGRRVDGEAKRITALLAPIETHLIGQEKIVDDEKARIKAEIEAKEAALLQIRIDTLCAFGARFNGQMYAAFGLQIPAALVKVCTDEQFDLFVAQLQEKKDEEDAKIKAEETARQVESDRLARIAAEQKAERMRLAEIARKQKEESSRLQAEQKKIADARQKMLDDARRAQELEKAKQKEESSRLQAEQKKIADARQKVLDDAKRAEELEKARKEGAEKALKEAVEVARQNALKLAEQERLAKIAAEKKEARRPDKEKLQAYLAAIFEIKAPDMKTPEGKAAWREIDAAIKKLNLELYMITEAL